MLIFYDNSRLHIGQVVIGEKIMSGNLFEVLFGEYVIWRTI